MGYPLVHFKASQGFHSLYDNEAYDHYFVVGRICLIRQCSFAPRSGSVAVAPVTKESNFGSASSVAFVADKHRVWL